MEFFGREDELAQLSALWNKRVSSLVTCRGRRRVGKSTLVERFAAVTGSRFVKIEGRRPRPGMSNADELAAFAAQLADQSDAERTARQLGTMPSAACRGKDATARRPSSCSMKSPGWPITTMPSPTNSKLPGTTS